MIELARLQSDAAGMVAREARVISIRGWPGTYVPGYRHSAPERGWGGEGISLPEG